MIPRTLWRPSEVNAVLVEETLEAAFNSEDFPAAIDRAEDDGADDGIEAGAISAAGNNTDAFRAASPALRCLFLAA